ncbi:MAG: hypothetical protein VB100_04545 [Angelakisella sp.]|nr:hypothetical protein [Angelakisella sp.]
MKFVSKSLLAICLMVMFSTTAFAYLDPSVATYAIQAVAGIVIAVGAVIGIYWRKAKKKTMDKLGIDENAKKEVEEDIVVYDEKE